MALGDDDEVADNSEPKVLTIVDELAIDLTNMNLVLLSQDKLLKSAIREHNKFNTNLLSLLVNLRMLELL